MTPLEMQALLIRHGAALRLVRSTHDRYALLLSVVCPSEQVEAASLAEAERHGITELAVVLSRHAGETSEELEAVREAAGQGLSEGVGGQDHERRFEEEEAKEVLTLDEALRLARVSA